MENPSTNIWQAAMTAIFILTHSVAQETDITTDLTPWDNPSVDFTCKSPTYIPRPLAPDVRGGSPFYVVAITRTEKSEEIDNICYTYFEAEEPFTHIVSIVYRNGSNSQIVLHKSDIEGYPGIAEGRVGNRSCVYHDYTLAPVCNQTAYPLYRCFLSNDCDLLDTEPDFETDSRVVLTADPSITPECAGDIAHSLTTTTELSGRQFLFLPNLLPPKCITTYTVSKGVTLQSIGAERALSTLAHIENQK